MKSLQVTEDQIIVSPFTKMLIDDEFNLKAVPIEKAIKGFENISECYEVAGKKDRVAAAFTDKANRKGDHRGS